MQTKYILTTILLVLSSVTHILSASYIWTGTSSTNWNTAWNWSSGIIPGVADYITLNSNAPNNLVLDQNRTVANFTINGDTLDLGTYTLTTTGVTYFNGGKIVNGRLQPGGGLCHFGGTVFDVKIAASCTYFHMNGGVFLKPVDLVSSGTSNTTGTGSNIFEDSLTITHSGVFYFTMGSSTNDFFNGPVTITNHATKEVYLANGDSSFYNANVTISSTGNGGVAFGNGGGVSVLASGKTISIGSGGFGADYLTLKKLKQIGTTAQTLTLTGTAIVNLVGCEFNGNLTLSAGGFLLKDNVFNSATTFTKTGTANCHSDGGNIFGSTVTLDNNGTSGRIRWATTIADTFNGNATFNSTTGQDVQVCYTGNNYFYKNLTINSNKVVFNTSTGKVTLAGDTAQSLNGSYNYAFKKLAINKNANQVTANTTLSVDDTLFFVKGNFLTKSSNLLLLKLGSTVIGASDSSYVEGPVKKTGNTAFVFPTGANNSYRPIEISAPATTTSEFIAEFKDDSLSVNTNTKDTTLARLLRKQYWNLNRTSGTSQVYVTVGWNSHSSLVDTLITVASWNGSQWKDLGNGIITGNHISGSIKSLSTASYYNQFIIGYRSNHTLPVFTNCNQVTTATSLQSCLQHSSQITITGNIDLDGNGIDFPLEVDFGVTLQGTSEWWKTGCPLITSTHTFSYFDATCFCTINPVPACTSSDCEPEALYLFSMQPGATIQNLRIRGANLDHKDFNDPEYLCGGIYVFDNGATAVNILNCEIFGFSQAGIWKKYDPDLLNIDNCYIHKVKGRSSYGIGYGAWLMSEKGPNVQEVNITNTVFDDCKASIDGQAHIVNWNINKCTLSQFFQSEDINSHNDNRFEMADCPCSGAQLPSYLNHWPYSYSTGAFYGKYWSSAFLCVGGCTGSFNSDPGQGFGNLTGGANLAYYTDPSNLDPLDAYEIPIHDVGGSVTSIQNSIFHKKWKLGKNGNINLSYPNLDDVNRNGNSANHVNISNNTFATELFEKTEVLTTDPYNNSGYAKIANNYIEADIWANDDDHIKFDGNSFSYQPGASVVSTAPQPHELALELNDGTNALPTSYSLSPLEGHKYIQYVNVNTQFYLEASITNAGSSAESYYIIWPNPNTNGVSTTSEAHVISNENYFFDSEEKLNGTTVTKPITYNKPGLYGIDVMGFDAHYYGTTDKYNFRASSWQHIPVIVKGTQEQMLYFNIKDSYHIATPNPTGVKKQAYLNKLLIWEEDIAVGGDGWELVEIDLTGLAANGTTNILDSIHTDGTENTLSFSIYMDNSNPNIDFSGVQVYVDDIYIPKTGSATGDNLVKDGSIELSKENLCPSCYWFQNLADQSTGDCGNTAVSINAIERKSGNQSLFLEIPFKVGGCTFTNSITDVVASIGTYIDFTDLLTCDNYVVDVDLDNVDITTVNNPYEDKVILIDNNLTIQSGETLTLKGCLVVIQSSGTPITITIEDGGILQIEPFVITNGNKITHFFACSNMWGGIVNEAGGTIDIITVSAQSLPTKIEDADKAIKSYNGDVNIRYAEFNNNYIGIELINYNRNPSNSSATEGLLGITFSCSDSILTKPLHEGEQPFANFNLIDVDHVNIGGVGSPANYRNKLNDAIYGIRANNSIAQILNTEFNNIGVNEGICRLCEGAIFAIDGSNLTIGGLLSGQNSNPFFRNYFKNSNVGIITRGVNTIDVKGNHFNEIGKGIIAHNALSSTITINENNEFYNVDNGIIAREITGNVTIDGNLFNPASLSTTDEFHYSNTAVTLQNYNDYATTTTNVIVSGNIIQDCRIGVHALNIPNISIGADMNSGIGNTITFTSEKGSYHCGIWIESCPSANIQGNEITKLSGGFSLEGITVTESADALINMNTITSADVPVHVFGNCSDTEFHCNYIDNQTEPGVGVVLDNAQLPDQGIKPSLAPPNGETWDNEWRGYTGSNYGVTGLPSQPFIWYFDVAQTYFDPNPVPGVISADALTSPDHFGCATLIANDDPDRDVRYGALVLDTLTFEDYSSEFIYKGKEQLYALIKSDTSILIRNTANDSVFIRFYNETMITNIALFDRVDSLILTGSLDPASDLNSSITDTNLIETNRKTVNDILISKVLMDVDLSATDSTTLEEIALQNPLTGGKAVYQARAILFLEVHYFNEALRLAHQLNETTNTVKTNLLASFELIPNPANDNCMVKFNEFNQKFVLQVRHATGQLVFSAELLPHTQSKLLDTSTMDPGVYFVFVNDGKAISEIKKLVVVR